MRKLHKVFMLLLFFMAGVASAYAQRTVTGTVIDENQ